MSGPGDGQDRRLVYLGCAVICVILALILLGDFIAGMQA